MKIDAALKKALHLFLRKQWTWKKDILGIETSIGRRRSELDDKKRSGKELTKTEKEESSNIQNMVEICQKWLENSKRKNPFGKYVQVNFAIFDILSTSFNYYRNICLDIGLDQSTNTH